MKLNAAGENQKPEPRKRLAEDLDFYFENGLMVLTEHFLRNRGYCCGNGCRHCPYQTYETKSQVLISPNLE